MDFKKATRHCKLCKTEIIGRRSKVFCTPLCKAEYHSLLNKVNKKATEKIDIILHRNRAILLEILGKNITSKKVHKLKLDEKKFNYTYVTAYHINSQNKTVNHVYDFSWIIFSDDFILIKRKKTVS